MVAAILLGPRKRRAASRDEAWDPGLSRAGPSRGIEMLQPRLTPDPDSWPQEPQEPEGSRQMWGAAARRHAPHPATPTLLPAAAAAGLPAAPPTLPAQLQAPRAQMMDSVFENWKLYGEQCLHNLSLLPPPTELVCNRTFDKYSCWPDTRPNTTASIACPWYLPWYHKVQHRFVYKTCGPDGQWVRGPQGQSLRNASQCRMDKEELEVQEAKAKLLVGFRVMYTVGYCLSLGALLLALAIMLGLRKLHCTRNYIHINLFASFVLKASSVLVIDLLLKTRYSQEFGDDLRLQGWMSDEALAGCRVATVFMQYGVVANACWLLVEGLYLHRLLRLSASPERRSVFAFYVGIGWGAPMLFVIPWAVLKCVLENIQCWTSHGNMSFWWILRFPVFLATLINSCIFIRILHILVAKLRAHQMHHTDYKFRLAKSTLTLIPLLGVHEVVFAFVMYENAQGTLRFIKFFFDLFLSSFQGLLVAVLYCFLNKEVQTELLRSWHRWRLGELLREERQGSGHPALARSTSGAPTEKLLLSGGCDSNGGSHGPSPSGEPRAAGSPPGWAQSAL
ncbi:glucagon receptor [Myotis daubentonii]|uniref:glucagon receptor n=1 Tax=Myotis daubentonii TaxID=98922 RepID=UPI0028730305|nr:glucagon receptor [Myotis daubentonii]